VDVRGNSINVADLMLMHKRSHQEMDLHPDSFYKRHLFPLYTVVVDLEWQANIVSNYSFWDSK